MASIKDWFASDSRRDLAICFLLALATLAVFWPSLDYGFVHFDDGTYVVSNRNVYQGLRPDTIAWALAPQVGHWHPLTWLSYMTEVEAFGVDPRGHHTVGLLLHIASTLVLYLTFRLMTGATLRSGALALLFAIHPLHVEPVVWISSRKDVLSGLFFVLTLLTYVLYVREPRKGRFALVATCMTLGLMSKSMLVTTPFVLLLLDLWPLQRVDWGNLARSAGALVREKVPLFILSMAAIAMAIYAANAHEMVKEAPLLVRVVNMISAYEFYVSKALWPTGLAVFYPLPRSGISFVTLATVVIGSALFTALALRSVRDRPYWLVGWLWYLGMVVPVSGIVTVAAHAFADRYSYLPLIGLFLVAVWGVGEICERWRPARIASAVAIPAALGTLMFASCQQVTHWKSSDRLFDRALSVTSDNWVVHRSLASLHAERGEPDGAIHHYVAALEIKPDDWRSHGNLALAYAQQEDFDRAIFHFQQALEIGTAPLLAEGADLEQRRAGYAAVHFNLALSLARVGRYSDARLHRSEAIRFDRRYERKTLPGLPR